MMDPNRFKFDAEEFLPGRPSRCGTCSARRRACDNTLLIAERCDVSFVEAKAAT